jgi:hypothetical protein
MPAIAHKPQQSSTNTGNPKPEAGINQHKPEITHNCPQSPEQNR